MATEKITKIDDIVVRFAGDSGDGMQLLPSLAMTSPPSPTIQPKSAPLTIPSLVCLAIRCMWVTTSIVPATNATSWSL